MCILKKNGRAVREGARHRGPGVTNGRACRRSKVKTRLWQCTEGEKCPHGQEKARLATSWGGGGLWGKAAAGCPAGAGSSLGRAGLACLREEPGRGRSRGRPRGREEQEGGAFPVKTGASSLKKLARRPCLLRQETAGDTGSHGHPELLPLSPSSLRARAAAVPCGCGSRAEGLLPERHRSRLPDRVPV